MAIGRKVWVGRSGQQYEYRTYLLNHEFSDEPGNYIFVKRMTELAVEKPLYVGETSTLEGRFENHHKAECARKLGITHIDAHGSSSNEATRKAEEQDLIEALNPPCND